jgi:hypothetical protein
LSDGQEAFPGKLWQADYIVCDTNRTMNITQCPQGEYFNPRLKKCMKRVPKGIKYNSNKNGTVFVNEMLEGE